ncbi:gamma-glutamyltransferase [Aurantimonas aggregata]|uniref:Gamma-glutamyltransferase n=1 Tax=Aurantimonas aggregata TaxID=2047720 RepID=A0A6L9MMW2_9HYPH|nr:gamma-glutamyltransferase family protein [Aurantimonas aggregata]NDV89153.1 gamma-glutamyltransferase [Aurantimonas aggregata]
MFDFFSGRRPSTFARRAMIATSHPGATAAGLEILQRGGNAVDAGIAAVAVQSVVDPLMTGVGGDCYALYAPAGQGVKALNGSGRTPKAATLDAILASGLTGEIPQTSAHAITVPGAISAWCRLHRDYGSLPLDEIFARAIGYANGGYVVTLRVAKDWTAYCGVLDPHAAAVFLPDGRPPRVGDIRRNPALGRLLGAIASAGAGAFYAGENAGSMVRYLQSLGGLHTGEDFADGADAAQWVEPISATYKGYRVHECPPNGQGVTALLILKILERFDLGSMEAADRIHVQAEATKLAYHHRDLLVGDGEPDARALDTLLGDAAIDALRGRIALDQAREPVLWDEVEHADTVYLSVVDDEGNALSLINSLFKGFGSGRMDPATGVLFHNRGSSFSLKKGHVNAIAPSKRPMHTIIPGMVTEDGRAVMTFGVMGGHYQATGHAAFLSDVFDRGLDLQGAIDEPRSFAVNGVLELEPGIPDDVRRDLEARGHVIKIAPSPIGGAQAIRLHGEALEGGSDSRKDGMALGY